MAQLVEWSLATPEIRSSNTLVGNFSFLVDCIEAIQTKKQESRMANLKTIVVAMKENIISVQQKN